MNKIIIIMFLLVQLAFAQDKNTILVDVKSGSPMLVGVCDRDAFADTNFAWWFNSGYKFYNPDTSTLRLIKEIKPNYTIKIVMGTWCSDSRREIPRFYRLLDEINFSEEKVTLINVDREKNGVSVDVSNMNIELVPTFIFYENDVEIGRIIETPNESLEEDYLDILYNIGL